MKRVLAVGIFLLLAVAAVPGGAGWTHFASKGDRFSTWYPPGWHPFMAAWSHFDDLAVINFPTSERVTGVVIPVHGAMIQAGPAPPGKTIEDLVQASTKFAADPAPLVDQTLLTNTPNPDACPTLRQIEYYDNLGSAVTPILEHWTSFYCTVHGRVFIVSLSYIRGNKDAKMLEAETLSVARSLRIEK